LVKSFFLGSILQVLYCCALSLNSNISSDPLDGVTVFSVKILKHSIV